MASTIFVIIIKLGERYMKRNMFINELSLSSLIVYENLVFLISIFYGKKCEF